MSNTRRPKNADFQVIDGIPYYARKKEDFEVCCDCSLVHRVKYEVVDSKGNPVKGARIRMTVWRDERATAARRRPYKFVTTDDE